jgi:hypothetical protein
MEEVNIGFVLGFVAGEGCFTVNIREQAGNIYALPSFALSVSERDEGIVQELCDLTGLGSVNYRRGGMVAWVISSREECQTFASQLRSAMEGTLFSVTEKSNQLERWVEFMEEYETPKTDEEVRTVVERAKSVNPDSQNGMSVEEWIERNE